nr:cupredoxin family copper-binding protein [uncultured Methanoregula sp.]
MSACAIMLILACLFAGCTSYSSTPGPATTMAVTPAPATGANTIAIKNFAFSPATLTVKAGTTVTWTNADGTSHTVVSDAGAPSAFTSPSIANGASFPFTFTQAGTYPYHCSIHPSMTGTIIVQS